MLRQPSSPVCEPSLLMISGLIRTIFCVGIFADRNVDHGEALADADLRRGQADAFGRVHGLEHVVDQLVQLGRVEFGDRLGLFFEHGLAVLHDRVNHQKFFTCSR